MKNILYRLFENSLFRCSPRGLDIPHNLARYLPSWKCTSIFDVGANVGQSASLFLRRFPDAHIYCFEPFPETFKQLKHNTGGTSRITANMIALSSSSGISAANVGSCSTNNSLKSLDQPDSEGGPTVQIVKQTLSEYCENNKINKIDYLKIDTEGHDLEVLIGAERMIDSQSVDVIHVEAGMNPKNAFHVRFESLKSHLEDRNYLLFGIYEQTGEFMEGLPCLRRANCVFISDRLNTANRRIS